MNCAKNKSLLTATVLILLFSTGSLIADSLTPKELLGKFLFFDKISSPDSMSCSGCYAPSFGFTGPIPGINKKGAVYRIVKYTTEMVNRPMYER